MDSPLLIGLILCGMGLGAVIYGIYQRRSYRSFREGALRARATVVEIRTEQQRDSHGFKETIFSPVLAFRTDTGQDVQTATQGSVAKPTEEEGQTVSVLYDPHTPSSALIERSGMSGRLLTAMVITFTGLLEIVVGGVLLVIHFS